jgi:predicted HAD superfamily Cof-like phosphohydrolase
LDIFTGKQSKIELLDSLADQIVTAIGVAHMFGFDISGALAEVNRSNFSKFEDGKPVFDANGKITKGKNYTPPELTPYI